MHREETFKKKKNEKCLFLGKVFGTLWEDSGEVVGKCLEDLGVGLGPCLEGLGESLGEGYRIR